jgi:hypothetical protein
VDLTGRIQGYAAVNLDVLGAYDWRLAEHNVWRVERLLIDWPHRRIRSSDRRYRRLLARYRSFIEEHPGRKPLFYRGRDRWSDTLRLD